MQSKRNRRILLAQDIVLVCLLPILCFLTIGSLQIGGGGMLTLDLTSSDAAVDCVTDFYETYARADGDELASVMQISPLQIWKAFGNGIVGLVNGLINGNVDPNNFTGMDAHAFDACADMLFIVHLMEYTLETTFFQGVIYVSLFAALAWLPIAVAIEALRALFYFLARLKEGRERHCKVVLRYRKALTPLFGILAFALVLPEVTLSWVWVCCAGLHLAVVIWNFIASRVKQKNKSETQFLNFVQFCSLAGVVLAVGFVVTLGMSNVMTHYFDLVRAVGGFGVLTDVLYAGVDLSKLFVLAFAAMALAAVALMVRYVYYGLLRVACLMESTRHKKVKRPGMITMTVFALVCMGTTCLLLSSADAYSLPLNPNETVCFWIAFGLVAAILNLEIVQKILRSVNRLDKERRKDLLCGCIEDQMAKESVVAEETPAEAAPAEETPAEETPAEETPAEETPAEETPAVETPAEETPAEETPTEAAPAEETPTEAAPAEETPAEETPAEKTPAEETPAEEAPAEETPAEETPAEEAPAEETPAEETPAE